MERTVADPLVEAYLHRLDVAAQALPADRRDELLGGIREHIDASIESGQVTDEASLRGLLDRLGEPEEIVGAAAETDEGGAPGSTRWAPPAPQVVYRRPGIGMEITAALFLTVGSLVLLVGWLVGVVLVWASRRWTLGEKLAATLVVPGGPAAALWLAGTATGGQLCTGSTAPSGPGDVAAPIQDTCTSTGFSLNPAVGIPLLLLWLVLPVVVAGVLVARARRRADLEQPIAVLPSSATASRWGGLEIAAVLLLGVGAFVAPVIAPAAGVLCAWLSGQWTRAEKWVATAIASVGLLLPLSIVVALLAARAS
jgi:hypothetical protein